MDENTEFDFTKLKYVLYARKSTDDPQRQIYSFNSSLQLSLNNYVIKILLDKLQTEVF